MLNLVIFSSKKIIKDYFLSHYLILKCQKLIKLILGPKAEKYRGLLSLKYPMEHSIVTDWNDMERVWQYIYSNDQLKVCLIQF